MCVTIDEAAHDQQEAGWASPRDFTVGQAAGGLDTLSFGLDEEATLHFGSGDPNGGNAFNGALGDVRIYDIALTPSEISALAGN